MVKRRDGRVRASRATAVPCDGLREEPARDTPLLIIIRQDGVSWDMEATALVKRTKEVGAAYTLVDRLITEKAGKI